MSARRWTDGQVDEALGMFHAGHTIAEIAQAMNTTTGAVSHVRRRLIKEGLLEPNTQAKPTGAIAGSPPQKADDTTRIRNLEKQVKLLEDRLQKMKSSRWNIPITKATKSKVETFCRAIIPDTHGSLVDGAAIAAVLDDLEALKPREVVWLGDHLECGGFLASHHTLGYVAQTAYTFENDVDATNDLLDKVMAVCPGAEHHYLSGNHERRIERWCLSTALRKQEDADFLLRHFGAQHQLHLADRGFNFYDQGKFYMGLAVPSVIKLGNCYFTHGHSHAKHHAAAMLGKYGNNVVFGHNHRSDEASTSTVETGTIKAWCPGCLCRLQPLWKHTDPSEWNHGYAIQLVQADGKFLHINVPVIDGKSYLMQLTEEMKAA